MRVKGAEAVSLVGESPVTTTEGARTRRGLKIAEIWSLESFPMVLQCWSVGQSFFVWTGRNGGQRLDLF